MNTETMDRALRLHYGVARHTLGRFWFRLGAGVQRLRWRWFLRSAPAAKRLLDIVGSLCFLIVFSPLYALIALLIKWEDSGPVIYAQTRVGRHGEEFKMFKFRSMVVNAESQLKNLLAKNSHAEGVTFKIANDPRITRAGKWLRKFSLDEIPQFYNVLRGDMSLVGPRPPVPREVALYTLADRRRLEAKPGITCYWQISGRSRIDFSGQVRLDVRYIEDHTLWGDVRILFKTIPAVLMADGAC